MTSRIVSASTTILAPPEVVFAILADPRQHARIDGSGSVKALTAGPDRLERGSEFGMDMKMYGLPYKIRNRVVEFEEGSLIAWRHFGGHRWRYELAPVGGVEGVDGVEGGTAVTESFDYTRYNSVAAKVLESLDYPGKNLRGIEETLVRLKAAAEADAPR